MSNEIAVKHCSTFEIRWSSEIRRLTTPIKQIGAGNSSIEGQWIDPKERSLCLKIGLEIITMLGLMITRYRLLGFKIYM